MIRSKTNKPSTLLVRNLLIFHRSWRPNSIYFYNWNLLEECLLWVESMSKLFSIRLEKLQVVKVIYFLYPVDWFQLPGKKTQTQKNYHFKSFHSHHNNNKFIQYTSDIKYSTISGWSNMAAQCKGVIFCTSQEVKHISFSWGCILNMRRTISMAPWAQAKWTGVDRSCCCVDILAPDFKQSSTAWRCKKKLTGWVL